MATSLELLLIQCLMPDNDARRKAEEQIEQFSKDPQVVPALVEHLRTAKTSNVRQLAAVLLRKKITGHWSKLTPQVRESVKSTLMTSITTETSSPVRRASANVVSVIAKYAVPAGEWQELLPFLFQCSQSELQDHREVALILFSSLTETIGDVFRPYMPSLKSLLIKSLEDESNTNLIVAALKAIGSFVEFVHDETDVLMYREFIPSILNASRKSLANGCEDVATIAFEIFDELVESPAPLVGPSVKSIVQFALDVSSLNMLSENTRHQAIQIISWLAKYRPKSLRKHGLTVTILQYMCPLLAEIHHEDDDNDLSAHRAAAEVIDTLAVNLPKKYVFPSVFEFSSQNFQSTNPEMREASITVLGIIAEGCYELMKNKLDSILHVVLQTLKDPDQHVRGASAFALGQFAEHLQPEIVGHYESILPSILNSLGDGSAAVQEKSYYALATFCENMGEEIIPYVDPLMMRLLEALQSNSRNLQEMCMSAIGSVAAAAEQAFVPYADRVLELMKYFMVLTKDEDLPSRTRATELVGIIALAVGRENVEPKLPPFIEAAIAGFALDFSELREYSHGFFSNIVELMGENFSQFLPRVVPLAFASCNLDDGSALDIDEDEDDHANGFISISSDNEDSDEPRVRHISIRTGVLDEKAAATQAIGMFALHTKSSFVPYFIESLHILTKHAEYFHEDVRLQAIISLQYLYTATQAVFPGFNELSSESKHVLDALMNIYLRTMKEDDDKEVVAQSCLSMVEIMNNCCSSSFDSYIPRIVEVILVLLREESACQEESDSDIDDNDIEHDDVLMDAVFDLLPALAKLMGSQFEPIFATFFQPLMKFAKASRPPDDRTMVVACLAEVAQEMGNFIASYVDKCAPLVLKEMASPLATNRRNAAFCIGELCNNGGEIALKYYNDVLSALFPMFGDSEIDPAVRDNAAGAVARMIMAYPQFVPLSQVMPVFLNALPLKEDLEESLPVYRCLCSLIISSKPEVMCLVPEVIKIFAQVIMSPEESSEVKAQISTALSHLISCYGDQMKPIVESLPSPQANALIQFASRSS